MVLCCQKRKSRRPKKSLNAKSSVNTQMSGLERDNEKVITLNIGRMVLPRRTMSRLRMLLIQPVASATTQTLMPIRKSFKKSSLKKKLTLKKVRKS